GRTPVERTALAPPRCGVREVVVTGDAEAAVRAAQQLGGGACREAPVRLVPVERLSTCFDGEEATLIARTDYWFDRRLLARFVEETQGAIATVVAVDFRRDALAAQAGAPPVAGR